MPSSFLPPWSKPHKPQLSHLSNYKASARVDLDAECAGGRHAPGHAREDGSGRMAGHADATPQHTTRNEEDEDEWQRRLKEVGRVEKKEMESLEKRYKEGDRDGVEEGLKKLFEDDTLVMSVRDVKNAIPDLKLEHPRVHGQARFVLPVTESAIKEQNWPGKAEQQRKDEEKKKSQQEASKKRKDASSSSDSKAEGDGGKGDSAEDQSKPKSHDEKKRDPSEKIQPDSDALGQTKREDAASRPGGEGGSEERGKVDGKGETEDHRDGEKAETGEKEQHSSGSSEEEDDEPKKPEMTEVERLFFEGIVAESKHLEELKNHDGTPLPPPDDDQVSIAIQVDDQFTPDSWVPRSNKLLRLTGKHPLNAEPIMTDLFEAGLVTPIKYHYVRNHAAVPVLQFETHRLTVGDVDGNEQSFSMDDLVKKFSPTELLVTIACDGNRRGEVNMVKKSAGFSWGAAGVSTCRWKGVLVRDLLLACGVEEPTATMTERFFLNFEGADSPSEGAYATSIPLAYAMDTTNDVLLAYAINGNQLHPDHGYPLRSIIPGYVGGRNVKWLKRIWVSREPNRSHYHIWDNRVIPSFVTDKNTPIGKAFFHHPDTACNEQVLQSVIAMPAHDEYISLVGKKGLDETYKIEGFAYTGGGQMVQKVEITLDGGQNWQYCFRKFSDSPIRHGNRVWSWCHWSCDVKLSALSNASEIRVRAWDPEKNTQPEQITWNLMGMMNNSQYRLKANLASNPETHEPSLHFIHPVAPGAKEGGWMKPNLEETVKQAAVAAGTGKEFTLGEVAKHNKSDDAWLVLNNNVYDVTSVLEWHPGGAHAILAYAGKASAEASTIYSSIHDGYANAQRDKVLIGRLGDKGVKALEEDSKRAAEDEKKEKEARAKYAVNPFEFTPAQLQKKTDINKDTRLYTFSLPEGANGKPKLGLPVGKHIQCALHFKDGSVLRSYTPTRPVLDEEDDGTFDLIVKTYLPGLKFAPGGTMGNYLDVMNIGETLDVKGPAGEIEYRGNGDFTIEGKAYHFDKINLVAGGSGLTPHWQLIHKILSSLDDPTQIALVDSNHSFDDILLFDELEKYAKQEKEGKGRFHLMQAVSEKPEGREWPYKVGRMDEEMLREHFALPDGGGVGTFLCGPPGLITHGAMPALTKMGFKEGTTIFGF